MFLDIQGFPHQNIKKEASNKRTIEVWSQNFIDWLVLALESSKDIFVQEIQKI